MVNVTRLCKIPSSTIENMYDQTESIPVITFDLLSTTWIFDLLGKAHAAGLFFYGFHGFTNIMRTECQKIDEQYVTQVRNCPNQGLLIQGSQTQCTNLN